MCRCVSPKKQLSQSIVPSQEMTSPKMVGKKQPADEVGNPVQGIVAQHLDLGSDSQPLDYIGPGGVRFDERGMVLPHSILGSLEEFRRYLEVKGETELVKRIPTYQKNPASEATRRRHTEVAERGIPSGHRNVQSNALHHWNTHMRQRRRQQDFLSDFLNRPVENLLMNQANHFRETQEQKEFLSKVMPLIHSGYGYRVGSEFWSLPQHYGDEMSGIRATLTRTEQGRQEPVTHVGQPNRILQQSGIICTETGRPSSRTWSQSEYLQQQYQELGEVLKDKEIKKPDISGLEVIGSSKPFTFVTVSRSSLLETEEEEHKEIKKENLDPLAQYEDVVSDALLIPALRFCGHLASWTGNSTSNQREVGISAEIIFEAPTGEIASSHLELRNEGSTAIFYSWQQLPVSHSFPNLQSHTKSPHFYFNCSSGVILPGDTQQVEFIFKSEKAGIKTEIWQLNTHPVLLQGASMQVTLKGLALYQDKTADQRLFIKRKLEKIVTVKMCRSIVFEVLRGVHTPERPGSPAELYVTEEETFVRKNPKLQYFHQQVEELKRLWQEVNPGHTWDLSVDTLRQKESTQNNISREKSLSQLNTLVLQLSEASGLKHHNLTAATIGQQLWKKLLDTMAGEAMQLKYLLGLPVRETQVDEKEESLICDADLPDNIHKDEKSEKRGGASAKEERSVAKSRLKDDHKGESKSAATEKSAEESKKRGKKKDEVGKGKTKEKQGKESVLLSDASPGLIIQQPPEDQNVELAVMSIYTELLHKKVYALMEELVDTLCDLMDEGHEQDNDQPNETALVI